MKSNWKLIRELMNAALDACEVAESLEIKDNEWGATAKIDQQDVSAWDFLQSSWRYPESLKNCIVRARHGVGQDARYVDEVQRTLVAVGMLGAELVGLQKSSEKVTGIDPYQPQEAKSAEELIQGLIGFYRQHMIPNLPKTLESVRK